MLLGVQRDPRSLCFGYLAYEIPVYFTFSVRVGLAAWVDNITRTGPRLLLGVRFLTQGSFQLTHAEQNAFRVDGKVHPRTL